MSSNGAKGGLSPILDGAQQRALKSGSPVVELHHLWLELAFQSEKPFYAALDSAGLNRDRFRAAGAPTQKGVTELDRPIPRTFDTSHSGPVEFQATAEVAAVLGSKEGGDLATSVGELCRRTALRLSQTHPEARKARAADALESGESSSGAEWLDGALDLTSLAESNSLDPLIGREEELHQLTRVLLRRRKRNPLLVGPPGVGKTALVEGLAQRIISGAVPARMRDWRIIALNVPKLLAGTSYRGEFEARMDELLQRVVSTEETHALFIDEFDLVISAGAAKGGVDAAAILKPYMARGDLAVIGACTEEDLSQKIMADPALRRRMAVVTIDELDIDGTRAVLLGMRRLFEDHHGVRITDKAIETCLGLVADDSQGHRPDNALELLDDACAHAVLTTDTQQEPTKISTAHIEAVYPG